MIKLFAFGTAFGLPDASPFVTKVDCYLRINNISFDVVDGASNLNKAPKGKLPFIDDDNTIIADSSFIIEHLNNKYQLGLDNWLSDEQKASNYLLVKSLDEHFYWTIVYSRWIDDSVWPIIKQQFFGQLPFPLKHVIPFIVRRNTRQKIAQQGLGAHSNSEIKMIADNTFKSLSTLLGDKKYICGDRICSLDATVFAMMSSVILADLNTMLKPIALQYKNLNDYCLRLQEKYYLNT